MAGSTTVVQRPVKARDAGSSPALPATPRVWHRNDPSCPPDAVYVGRPTKWGNPFRTPRNGDRDTVIRLYRALVIERGWPIEELRGKHLSCWCAPKRCHADVLLELANT